VGGRVLLPSLPTELWWLVFAYCSSNDYLAALSPNRSVDARQWQLR
jgi:hypothetical protein